MTIPDERGLAQHQSESEEFGTHTEGMSEEEEIFYVQEENQSPESYDNEAQEISRRRRLQNNIDELNNLYSDIHHEEIGVWSKPDQGSIIPVIREDSIFVDCYSEEIYDIILEDLREQYDNLTGQE